jgi:hypothetical protein
VVVVAVMMLAVASSSSDGNGNSCLGSPVGPAEDSNPRPPVGRDVVEGVNHLQDISLCDGNLKFVVLCHVVVRRCGHKIMLCDQHVATLQRTAVVIITPCCRGRGSGCLGLGNGAVVEVGKHVFSHNGLSWLVDLWHNVQLGVRRRSA